MVNVQPDGPEMTTRSTAEPARWIPPAFWLLLASFLRLRCLLGQVGYRPNLRHKMSNKFCCIRFYVESLLRAQADVASIALLSFEDKTEFGILSDVLQKAFLNFIVAAMAATSAVKGNSKLHTSMIRTLEVQLYIVDDSKGISVSDFLANPVCEPEALALSGWQLVPWYCKIVSRSFTLLYRVTSCAGSFPCTAQVLY